MKKIILLSAAILIAVNFAFSQGAAINTNGAAADNSAMLDIVSSTKGLLIPRMTTSDRNNIVSPSISLLIFNTDCNCFQSYLNSQWQNVYCDLGCTAAPATPGTITGNDTLCQNTTGVSYYISQVPGATSYNWTVPFGASIVTGQGTTGIIVNFGTSSGNITVAAGNNCGASFAQSLGVFVMNSPAAAGSISGTAGVCAGQSGYAYSVGSISGATGYVWSYSGSGFSIASGNNTSSITADFAGGATSGNLTVYGTNACDTGVVSPNFAVTVNSVPSSPTEGAHVPGQTQIEWIWNTVPGATGYKWNTVNVYSTATDMGTNTSNTETSLTCATAYTSYVWAYNTCGNSTGSTTLTQTTSSCCSGDGTGGTITHSGGKTIHTFTSSGTFTPPCAMDVEALVVAGGGGGANGGGGAGGFIYNSSYSVTVQGYTVTVGNGGARANLNDYVNGSNGANSVFGTLTAIGGGGGGCIACNGSAGGSGGGSGMGTVTGGAGTAGQGNNGGNTTIPSLYYPTAGGGGAGAAGQNTVSNQQAGSGGVGLANPIAGSLAGHLVSGTYYFAGGGGGGINNNQTAGLGGNGGGGNGCSPEPCWASAGMANTGGGGGGADGSGGGAGGDGGSGIVIITYITP